MTRRILSPKKNRPDRRENTDKEQISLAPGSAEYKERIRDLKECSPDKPDDEFHVELESKNEIQAGDVLRENQRMDEQNDTAERKFRNQTSKRTQFGAVKSAAIVKASKTETLADDKKAKRMMPKNLDKVVYDDGVVEDDYLPTALKKYL